jgi:uncharacterized protein (DUF1697 family)
VKVVGLLRGINVGTSVKIPMKELKRLIEKIGATDVVTYLNSGNVVFSSNLSIPKLRQQIEKSLKHQFGAQVPVLLLNDSTVIAIRDSIPKKWENSEFEQTYVAYLFPEVDSASLIDDLPVKHHLIDFRYVPSAIIWNIKRENYNKSQITKIASHKAYGKMTTRNVNTARKLAELCES